MEIRIKFDPDCIRRHTAERHDFLSNVHTFQYDEKTRVVDLFRSLFSQSGLVFPETIIIENGVETCIGIMEVPDPWLFNLFLVSRDNDYLTLWDVEKRLYSLLEYLGMPDTLLLYYESNFSDGKAFDKINGIKYYFNSGETCHLGRPHIHAEYGDDNISIDLNNITVLEGRFKNIKKQKEALKFIRNNRKEIIQCWNSFTNGFNVDLTAYE